MRAAIVIATLTMSLWMTAIVPADALPCPPGIVLPAPLPLDCEQQPGKDNPCYQAAFTRGVEDPRCPRGPASCVAYGLLVMERDPPGGLPVGDLTIDLAQSKADAAPAFGSTFKPPAALRPAAPAPAQAHADAELAGASYSNLGLSITASTVHSRCDAAARTDFWGGELNHAYGRAGAQDLAIAAGLSLLTLDAVSYEQDAIGTAFSADSFASCDVVELNVLGGPPELNVCPPPGPPVLSQTILGNTVTIWVNEVWPVAPVGPGLWSYGGAAVHAQVVTLDGQVVDVYVGLVSLTVQSHGPAAPATWKP